MIEVRLFSDSVGRLKGLFVSGHSGYARAGSDIVCAAVSAITQAAVLGLEEVLELAPEVRIDDEAGLLELTLAQPGANKEREAQAVLETAARSLERLSGQYPKYLRVRRMPAAGGGK